MSKGSLIYMYLYWVCVHEPNPGVVFWSNIDFPSQLSIATIPPGGL